MTSNGKITAANLAKLVRAGIPVRVLLTDSNVGDYLAPATRKTGVKTLTVTAAETTSYRVGNRNQRAYRFVTSAGRTGNCAPVQTFILAPEDAPAVKRAHAEALAEDMDRSIREHEARAERMEAISAPRPKAPAGWEDRGSAGLVPASTPDLGEQLAHEQRQRDAVGAVPAFTEVAPGMFTAPVGTPEPETLATLQGTPRLKARRITPEEFQETVGRTDPAMERPFLAPIARVEQAPRYSTDQRLKQLLAMLDAGTVFEMHPDGWWRDRAGLTGSLLDTVALKDAVNEACRVGLAGTMGANSHVANPTLVPAPIHRAVGLSGARFRPLCGWSPMDSIGELRRRYTHKATQVTCSACIDVAAEQRRQAEALAENQRAAGIVPDATVTVYQGHQRYTVTRVEEDMAEIAPIISDEDRESIEAAGGTIKELQWITWTLLRPVPASKL